jgi:hypothetical protein
MRCRDANERRRDKAFWGIGLMLLGVVFLLMQFDVLPRTLWHGAWALWPLGFGVARLITARDAEALGSAVTLTGIGAWLLLAANGWYGLTWARSWPLSMVAVGLGILVRSLAAGWGVSRDVEVNDAR